MWEIGEIGDWAEPDFDHLVVLMREALVNRERWRAFGESASDWLRERTWERTAEALCEVMMQDARLERRGDERQGS
jgi:hypothetical protein